MDSEIDITSRLLNLKRYLYYDMFNTNFKSFRHAKSTELNQSTTTSLWRFIWQVINQQKFAYQNGFPRNKFCRWVSKLFYLCYSCKVHGKIPSQITLNAISYHFLQSYSINYCRRKSMREKPK